MVGILPEEEAALNRALYASLQDEKKSPEKQENQHQLKDTIPADDVQQSIASDICGSPSHRFSFDSDSLSAFPLKKIRLESLSDCSSPFSALSPPPSAFGQASGYSTPVGSPESAGSSLKLVLSASSWSSSSSNWSLSEVSSPEYTETAPEAASHKRKKKGGGTPSRNKKGKGRGKGKLVMGSFLFGTPGKDSLLKSPPRGKSPKSLFSTNKSPKPLKTPPKLAKSPKNSHSGGKKRSPSSKEKQRDDDSNRSKQLKALLHDHCYFAGVGQKANDSKPQERANAGAKGSKSSPTSPGIFQAQRKFAQNPAPLHLRRPLAEEAEKMNNLKEVPKTEDFITFLCLRGSNFIPENFRKFSRPWTPRSKRGSGKNGQRLRLVRTVTGGNGKVYI